MNEGLVFENDNLVLDACCAINLYATGRIAEILESLPLAVHVAEYVKDREALTVYATTEDAASPDRRKEKIDFEPLLEKGILRCAALDRENEADLFVRLAGSIDDGEAHTGAIAISRGWSVATDDGKAIKVLTKACPRIRIVQTPEIILFWAEAARAGKESVRETLLNIELRAHFWPSKANALRKWWAETRI